MIKKILAFLLLCLFIHDQSVPTITPINSMVRETTGYRITYYSFKTLSGASSYFRVDFSQSKIQVPEGTLSGCEIVYNNVRVNSPTCTCENKICTFKPNHGASMNTKVEISFEGAVNPSYMSNQNLPISIYFSPMVTPENYNVVIPFTAFTPMQIIKNSLNQTDWSVGTFPTTYQINVTLPYVSKNPQLQIQIPQDINYQQIGSELSLDGTVQNFAPIQILNILVFNLQTPAGSSKNMLLTLSGLGNPQFLGLSRSFRISLIETEDVMNCASCKIAEITSGLEIESKTAGNIEASTLSSSNQEVEKVNTISLNCLYYAPILAGGFVKIYLDPAITAVNPVTCENVFGFSTLESKAPKCTYNSSTNVITTTNFAYPNLVTFGNGIISFNIINPSDSRTTYISVETYDSEGRMIGISKNPFIFSALPKVMTATISKSNSYVGTEYTLSAEITLGQDLNQENYIELVFPAGVAYNLTAIKCLSAGVPLDSADLRLDEAGQLIVTFEPPCVQCTAGAKVKFEIKKLMNPSFVNDPNQLIYLHIRTEKGIIEGKQAVIQLTPSSVQLEVYDRPANKYTGSIFDLFMKFTPSAYIQENGGQLMLEFTPGSTYIAPLRDEAGMLAGYDYEIEVIQGQTASVLTNTVQYNNDDPASVLRVAINICDGPTSTCSPNTPIQITLRSLRMGYIPSQNSTDKITLTTTVGDVVAVKSLDTSSKAPVKYTTLLIVNYAKSVTNSISDLSIQFESPSIVFTSAILRLPAGVTLNGECSISLDLNYGTQFSCLPIDSHSLQINMMFELVYMIGVDTTFFIHINGVSTPTSTQPMMYTLEAYFNDVVNQHFSVLDAMDDPLTLETAEVSPTNSTINEINTYNMKVLPVTESYTGFKVIIPKQTSIASSVWATQLGYSFTQNTTHYILSKSGKLTDIPSSQYKSLTFKIRNNYNTVDKAEFTVILLDNSYEVQKVTVDNFYNEPIMLGVQCTSSNRTTGATTTLSCSVDRNNVGSYGEESLNFQFDNETFDCSGATFNGQNIHSDSPFISIPIETNSPKVINFTVSNLINRRYIPNELTIAGENPIMSAEFTTKDSNDRVIGSLAKPISDLMANEASNISCSAVRSITKSGQYSDVEISCSPSLAQAGDYISFALPAEQTAFQGTSNCKYEDGEACEMVNSNETFVTVVFRPNLKIILEDTLNYHKNENMLKVLLSTNPNSELIEKSELKITPDIELEQVHTVVTATSSTVSSVNNLKIVVTPENLSIKSNNEIVVNFPDKFFTKELNTQECSIDRTNGMSFFGCSYAFYPATNNISYISGVTFTSFGPNAVEIGEEITLNIPVTNGPALYLFKQASIRVNINENTHTFLSEGNAPLAEIYPSMTSFSKIGVNQHATSITQSSLLAQTDNSMQVSVDFMGNVHEGTKIIFMAPKDSYSLPDSSTASFLKEDSSYNYLSYQVFCSDASKICENYSFQSTFTLHNNKHLKNQRNNVMVYAEFDGTQISQPYTTSLTPFSPSAPPQFEKSRNSSEAGQNTVYTYSFSFDNIEYGDITVSISSEMVNRYFEVTGTFTKTSENGETGNSLTNNPSFSESSMLFHIDEQFTSNSLLNQININCQNTLIVPIGPEKYWFEISNSTHLLYQVKDFQFETKMQPLSVGVALERTNPQVTKATQLYLGIHLPYYMNFPYSSFNIFVTTGDYGTLSGYQMEVDLGQHYNPPVIFDEAAQQVSICNDTHCIYENNNQEIIPALTSFPLTLVTFNVSTEMTISSTEVIEVALTYPRKKDKFILELPSAAIVQVLSLECKTIDENSGMEITQPNVIYSTELVPKNEDKEEGYQIIISSPTEGAKLSLSNVKVFFMTPQYHRKLHNSVFKFYFEKPSTEKVFVQDINIYGTSLATTVTLSSQRINEVSNYTISTNSLSRNGVLRAYVPEQISKQMMGSDEIGGNQDDTFASHVSVSVNSVAASQGSDGYEIGFDQEKSTFYIQLSTTADGDLPQYQFSISEVTNPADNRPLEFFVCQHEASNDSQIFAYSEKIINMNELDLITCSKAERNDTKINEPIKMDISLVLPQLATDRAEVLRISMARSQVRISQIGICTLLIDQQEVEIVYMDPESETNEIFFEFEPQSEVPAEEYFDISGEHVFTIAGCIFNSEYSQSPDEDDKVYVSVGMPYQSAETIPSSSVFISPEVTTGNMIFSDFESTSFYRWTYTDLSFSLEPENFQNCDGIVVVFSEDAYYTHENIMVSLNNQGVRFQVLSHNEIFIQVGDLRSPIMDIKITRMINFIESGPMTIFTVKRKEQVASNDIMTRIIPTYNDEDYGVIDLVATGNMVSQLLPSIPSIRLIVPDAYVSDRDQTLLIMIDSENPAEYPSNDLQVSLTSSAADCSRSHLPYSSQISVTCQFSSSGQESFSVVIKDESIGDVVLGQITKSVYIYPGLKEVCSNVLCDDCSPRPGGGQYCFQCREGMYSSKGVCVDECPSRKFPYLGQTCQSCSPDCAECYDINDRSCLECADSSLYLDSGECNEICTTGQPFKKYCVSGEECTTVPGCRLCSETGVCYICLPGFSGLPDCEYQDNLPVHLFVFFIIPIAALAIGLSVYECVKYGFSGVSGLCYFMLATIQFFSMVFLIARVGELAIGMLICAFILLRIILSIVSYETYYLKKLGDTLLTQEERDEASEQGINGNKEPQQNNEPANGEIAENKNSFKMRLTKFSAHFLCCEAYELLNSQIGEPKRMNIKHHPWYMKFNHVSRILLMVMAVVALSTVRYPSDLLWLSLFGLISGAGIFGIRILKSQALARCLSRCRGNA